MTNQPHILQIDASGRYDGSASRELTALVADHLAAGGGTVTTRDLVATPPSFVDESWVGANFTDPAERTAEQSERLAESEALVAEVRVADVLVIGVPIYNFGVPAVLKAWIDQVVRARLTFQYTENGPVGLLEGKKAYVVVASGGTTADSEIDFATGYMRHILGFIGIKDVTVFAADKLMAGQAEKIAAVKAEITRLGQAA